MLTSSCRICHQTKADIVADLCVACKAIRKEAEQGYAAEHPAAAESDILYAGRQALNARAHYAHRNFVDPRDFSAGRGLIPAPPADNRGTPEGAGQ